jgi:hypothetical protein
MPGSAAARSASMLRRLNAARASGQRTLHRATLHGAEAVWLAGRNTHLVNEMLPTIVVRHRDGDLPAGAGVQRDVDTTIGGAALLLPAPTPGPRPLPHLFGLDCARYTNTRREASCRGAEECGISDLLPTDRDHGPGTRRAADIAPNRLVTCLTPCSWRSAQPWGRNLAVDRWDQIHSGYGEVIASVCSTPIGKVPPAVLYARPVPPRPGSRPPHMAHRSAPAAAAAAERCHGRHRRPRAR